MGLVTFFFCISTSLCGWLGICHYTWTENVGRARKPSRGRLFIKSIFFPGEKQQPRKHRTDEVLCVDQRNRTVNCTLRRPEHVDTKKRGGGRCISWVYPTREPRMRKWWHTGIVCISSSSSKKENGSPCWKFHFDWNVARQGKLLRPSQWGLFFFSPGEVTLFTQTHNLCFLDSATAAERLWN